MVASFPGLLSFSLLVSYAAIAGSGNEAYPQSMNTVEFPATIPNAVRTNEIVRLLIIP